jgi:hypothetical protein
VTAIELLQPVPPCWPNSRQPHAWADVDRLPTAPSNTASKIESLRIRITNSFYEVEEEVPAHPERWLFYCGNVSMMGLRTIRQVLIVRIVTC